ncbi:MAG: hypothetical protein R2911_35175 [Caldilineaceae bacterium]
MPPHLILNLPAEVDAAAQVGGGVPQRADGQLGHVRQIAEADGEAEFIVHSFSEIATYCS